MKNIYLVNPEKIADDIAMKYRPRSAARGVVFDENNNVAILLVSNHNYYKLPGGGIEESEDKIEAFRRECVEEIGSDVEVIKELGPIVEYRSESSLIQTSYCYVGKVVGERKASAFTEHELSQGFEKPLWVTFDEALKLVSNSEPNNYSGRFIKERDTFVLNTVKQLGNKF